MTHNTELTLDTKMLTWTIGLSALFILTLVIADFAAVKFLDLGWVITPAGSLLFAVVFVTRDMIHKVAGARIVKRVILIGIALNILAGSFMYGMTLLPNASFRPADAFNAVFALAPGIVLGSVIAAFFSQTVNTWVYQQLWNRNFKAWTRTIISNTVSLPVDAVLFTVFAFMVFPHVFGGAPLELGVAAARVASGQTLFKLGIILLMTPLVSLTPTSEYAKNLK